MTQLADPVRSGSPRITAFAAAALCLFLGITGANAAPAVPDGRIRVETVIVDPRPGAAGAGATTLHYAVAPDGTRTRLAGAPRSTETDWDPEDHVTISGHLRIRVVGAVTAFGRTTQTVAATTNAINTTIAAYWSSVSGGRLSVSAEAGPEGIDISDVFDCGAGYVSTLLARAYPGGVPAGDAVMVLARSDCPWAGVAVLGAPGDFGTFMAINDITNATSQLSVPTHEIGHNLGFAHATSETCPTPDSPAAHCTTYEYGDVRDLMGCCDGGMYTQAGQPLPPNPSMMRFAGWEDQIGEVVVSGPATVRLAPYQSRSGQRVATLTGRDGSTYFLSYATPIRWQSWSEPQPLGVQVRRVRQSERDPWYDRAIPSQSWLVDMPAVDNWDHTDDLTVGQSWSAPSAGIAFTVDAVTADEAIVRITQAADPAAVFTVRPPAPPPPPPSPSPPPPSTDGPDNGPGIGVGASRTRVRGGSAHDRRLDLTIAWDVSGSTPSTSTSLSVSVNGVSAGRVDASAASIRLPVASATLESDLRVSDVGVAITAQSSSTITAAAGRPTRRRDWRKVHGAGYVGGSAWRLMRARGTFTRWVTSAETVALVTGPGPASTVSARDSAGSIAATSRSSSAGPWAHAFSRRDPLTGPVVFTITGRGAMIDAVVTVAE